MERNRIKARARAGAATVFRQPPAGGRRGDDRQRQRDSERVVASLRKLFQAVQKHSKAIQNAVGLSAPQVWALRILHAEAGLSLGALADRMYAHPSTVSGIVDRLVTRKVVRRVIDPHDRRGVRLSLTPKGRRAARASPLPFQESLREALEDMPATRLRRLRESLEEIARTTDADKLSAPFFDVKP